MRRSLELKGYAVSEAANGADALAVFARDGADVLVLDLTMPELDGLGVARRLRAQGALVPIVLSSGYLHAEVDSTKEPGLVQVYLAKPYTITELMEAIARARG